MALRVVLADDAALIRGALAQLLDDGGVDVLAQVGTPAQLLAAIEEHQPDVALVDIRMPPTYTDEGIRAAKPANTSRKSASSCSPHTSRLKKRSNSSRPQPDAWVTS